MGAPDPDRHRCAPPQIDAAGGAPEMQAKLPGLQRKLLDAYTSAGMLPEAERAIEQVRRLWSPGAGMHACMHACSARR